MNTARSFASAALNWSPATSADRVSTESGQDQFVVRAAIDLDEDRWQDDRRPVMLAFANRRES